MSPILALSVTDKIEQYGAYAGFASVLGLAVLSLLYFAQARELKRLREWAGRAPERAAELEQRPQAAVPAGRAPAPQGGVAPVAQPAAQAAARPAGAPAPATAAAQATQAQPAQPGQSPGVPAPATAAAAGATAAAAPAGAPAPAAPGGPNVNQPTTVQPAAGTNGAGAPGQPVPRPGQPLRPPAGSASARSLGAPPASDGRSRGAILAIVGAIAAVLVVALVLVFGVFGGSDDGGGPSTQAQQTTPATAGGGGTSTNDTQSNAPISPGSFTTAVLNGTTVPGLARGVANRLEQVKFRTGTVRNALNQTRSQTLVEYQQGHKREGLLVAKAIDVGADAVQPISSGSQTLAGDAATVVVTVGADQNTSPQQ